MDLKQGKTLVSSFGITHQEAYKHSLPSQHLAKTSTMLTHYGDDYIQNQPFYLSCFQNALTPSTDYGLV